MFRLLVTAVTDYAIYMLDPGGRVASWNPGAQHIKGYTEEEILGQHYRVFYPDEDRAAQHPERNLAHALREGSYAEEGWRVRRNGTRFWASVVITAVFDDDGRHRGFAKVTRDQSELRAREEQRRLAIEQQANLLAVTAHELRTPAAVVEGAAAMLSGGQVDDRAERIQLVEAMATSAERIQRLAGDLRAASDTHADALALQPERMSLRGALLAAADRARAVHPHEGVTVEVADDVELIADAARVGQALDNLLDNAIRHGRAPVLLQGERTDAGVRMTVADNGHGVDQRLESRLFERFAHAGPAGGAGIGLHLVRQIAPSHGGEVSYLPPGRGSSRPSCSSCRRSRCCPASERRSAAAQHDPDVAALGGAVDLAPQLGVAERLAVGQHRPGARARVPRPWPPCRPGRGPRRTARRRPCRPR